MKKVKFDVPDQKAAPKAKQPKPKKEAQIGKKMAKRLNRGMSEMTSQIARYEKMDSYG